MRLAPRTLALVGLLTMSAPIARAEVAPAGRWIIDAGLSVRARPTHIGSDTYVADLFPVLDLQYGSRVHISLDDGAKWSALRAGAFSFGPLAEYRQSFNDKLPPRSPRLSDAVELGGFGQADVGIGVFEGRLRHAVTGYGGDSADLAFDTGLALTRRISIGLELRSSWADRQYTRRLRLQSGAPSALPTRTQDYFTGGAQLSAQYTLPRHCTLGLEVSEDRTLSPQPARFAASRNLLGAALVFTHRWGSPRRFR